MRWGTEGATYQSQGVPTPVVRAQHCQLREALPSLAAKGFAQVLLIKGEGIEAAGS